MDSTSAPDLQQYRQSNGDENSSLQAHMIAAVEKAGAAACYVSGAGPSFIALTSDKYIAQLTQREKERVEGRVADAMRSVAESFGVEGEIYLTQPTSTGAYVSSVVPPFSNEKVLLAEYIAY